jgi:hypothetical protein
MHQRLMHQKQIHPLPMRRKLTHQRRKHQRRTPLKLKRRHRKLLLRMLPSRTRLLRMLRRLANNP